MTTLRPRALDRSARVAVVTPSWAGPAAFPVRHRRSLGALAETLGCPVEASPHAESAKGWVSASGADRAADLTAAFADPHVTAVFSAVGGEHTAQLLEHVDWDAVRGNPTIFCGYSDVTAIHLALWARCRMHSFYGPATLPQFGELPAPDPYTVAHLLRAIGGRERSWAVEPPPYVVEEFVDWADEAARSSRPRAAAAAVRPADVAGTLLVACLPTMCSLVGTNWCPDTDGTILLLDLPDGAYGLAQVDRDLTHLRLAGLLDGVRAVGYGWPRGYSGDQRAALRELFADHTNGPVVPDLPIGHADPVTTLPIGVPARLAGGRLVVEDNGLASG